MADQNFNLPKELRLIIFEHLFTTPQGIISLRDSSPAEPRKIIVRRDDKPEYVSLSILRTCKRFYGDCKDLLWKLNTFDLELVFFQSSPHMDQLYLNTRIWNNFRSVQLEIEFSGSESDTSRAGWLESYLYIIGSWKNLANISFIVRGDFSDCVKAMNGLLQIRQGLSRTPDNTTMEKCLRFLKRAGMDGGYLCHLRRKIVFDFKYENPTDRDWTSPNPPLEIEDDPIVDYIFMELATSFGGDIIINGDVCYTNRVRKQSPFYTYLHPENTYTQVVSLKKECVLKKLGFIYTKSTSWSNIEIRSHLLGKTTLQVSPEQMEAIRKDLEDWLKWGPKQLAKFTREMIEGNPLKVVGKCKTCGLICGL